MASREDLGTPSEIVEGWNKKFQDGQLTPEIFKVFWKQIVPNFYTIKEDADGIPRSVVDERSTPYLFHVLELFIFTRNTNSTLKELEKIESPLTACGHVFRYGESTYTCRDCAMDATCVLCVDCFKQSVHRHHRYKMSSSIGGGCCDCGDKEAWKSEPWCTLHKRKTEDGREVEVPEESAEQSTDQNCAILNSLDPVLVNRVKAVFSATCRYAYDILTFYNYQVIPEGVNMQIPDLMIQDPPDTYCTILYNDESHTYDQVNSGVCRAIKCPQKVAMELVTQIDRDGRAVLKYGDFEACHTVLQDLQRHMTRYGHGPLKIIILHSITVAHQTFALEVLAWVEKMVKSNKGLRLIFSQVVAQKSKNSILEGVMLRDCRMWKFARMQWNRLFFHGLLLEYETKKMFAKYLTTNYNQILTDFMNDDHDHSFSVASLSVQVYTVPSLSLYLIEQEEVLFKLINAFYSECLRLCNEGKLGFGRNPYTQQFKRCHYVLYDLRYLLSFKPKIWNLQLRKNFLHGFSVFLKVLSLMQGMEGFTRCLFEHAEYEQEWETAFFLHFRLAFVISLVHEWCGEDKAVLLKAYKVCLKKISENPLPGIGEGQLKKCEVAKITVHCLDYDVSRKQVSIHIPLTRLLAALHLHLQKFDLDFDSSELDVKPKPTIEQIVEPVLRQQALIAQVHANMWRRNGTSLPNQLQWYANCKCRTEMLDRDIAMLQIAAAYMGPDKFIISVLNKFNLVNWANDTYNHELQNPEDDSLRQVITLAEEFLGLLITVVGERFMPGIGQVTSDECLCHEIVQQLCIKPMTHSELNHCLHKDFNHETGLENVVDKVAILKEQSQGKMQYELKPDGDKEFNLFFYHFTREDRSKAEENQRKKRKVANELECCPPPLPPLFTPAYTRVAELLHCDVMLSIMKNVISRTMDLHNSCFSELQLQEILYLMGYALLEEERTLKDSSRSVQQKLFSNKAEELTLLPSMLNSLLECRRVEAQGQVPLISWVLGKYRQVIRLRNVSSDQLMEAEHRPGVASDDETARKQQRDKDRSDKIAQHRARTMQQMMAMQANFMKENASMLADVENEMKDDDPLILETPQLVRTGPPVALGHLKNDPMPVETRFTCILCQETEVIFELENESRPMVMACLVVQSTVGNRKRDTNIIPLLEDQGTACKAVDSMCLSNNLGPAPFVKTCGHKMHADCFNRYYENTVQKEARRSFRRVPPAYDVEKQEYVCPLCNNVSNCALPVLPPMETISAPNLPQEYNVDLSLDEFVEICSLFITLTDIPKCEKGLTYSSIFTECTSKTVANILSVNNMSTWLSPETAAKFSCLYPKDKPTQNFLISREVWDNINNYTNAVFYAGRGSKYEPGLDIERLALIYQSCAYTVHMMEWIQRDSDKPLLGHFTTREEEQLRYVIQNSVMVPARNIYHIQKIVINLLACIKHKYLDIRPCILEWDSFGMLVSLVLSLPQLLPPEFVLPCCGVKEKMCVHLLLVAHMIQLMLGMKWSDADQPMEVDTDDQTEGQEALKLLQLVRTKASLPVPPAWNTARHFWKTLKQDCIPFLRCCAIFFRYLSGVPDPPELTERGGDTFEELCRFLGLPSSCTQLLEHKSVSDLATLWCSHSDIQNILNDDKYVSGVVKVNQLITLPQDFMDLINSVSIFKCPLTNEESRNPTLCLVCGQLVCLQSYCCQVKLKDLNVGPCMYHAYRCGANIGLFFRIRECELIVLNSPHRGCFATPPYQDKYGETDEGLRRGNPLYLCSKSYKELQTQWLSHSLTQTIGRTFDELNLRNLAYQWRAL